MQHRSIKRQLLAHILFPISLIVLMTSLYFNYQRGSDLTQALIERAHAIVRQLVQSYEIALAQPDNATLLALSQRVLEERDIRAISIYDSSRTLRLHVGPAPSPLPPTVEQWPQTLLLTDTDGALHFKVPIFRRQTPDITLEAPAPATFGDRQLVGWLALEVSKERLTIEQYRTLWRTLLLGALALLLCSGGALLLARRFTDPLQQISQAIHRIRRGDLDNRLSLRADMELESLATDINDMAEALQTARDNMEQHIQQTTNDLQETMDTIEVQNIKLDMARKEAQEASRIKSQFLANMSHEIRTPLNGIIGFTKLLLKSPLNQRQRDYLHTIQKSSESLLAICNDILDFSKIEAGKMTFDAIPMNLRETIEDVMTMLAPQAHEKQLELVTLIYEDVPLEFISDPERIRRVLTNLIGNAIKFTDQGEVVLRAMLEDQQADQATLKISVTDTGIGLSKPQQKELFQAFVQADNGAGRKSGGTGLGLSICKQMVEKMGGEIGLESELHKGSTFWVTLQVKPTHNSAEAEPEPLQGWRVALLESHPLSRLSVSHTLTAWGVEVQTCEQPGQLQRQLQQPQYAPYDAIIVGLNQAQWCQESYQQLLALIQHQQLPLIVLLSASDPQLYHQLYQQRIQHALAKPVESKKLYQALRQLHQPATTPAVSAMPAPGSEAAQRPRVLAVDDNAANLKLVITLLEELGVDTLAATTGKEAIEQVRHQAVDLVFMDVQMPEMGGIEATRLIRRLPGKEQLPIVALTAHALPGERDAMLEAGMDDYLTKPIDEAQLAATLQRWLAWTPASGPAPQALPGGSTAPAVDTLLAEQDSPSPVDMEMGVKLVGGKEGLAKEMLKMLIDSLADDQRAINAAFQQGDYARMQEQVHKLHGATRYCGVPQLALTTEALETQLKTQRHELVGTTLATLNEEIERLHHWAQTHSTELEIG